MIKKLIINETVEKMGDLRASNIIFAVKKKKKKKSIVRVLKGGFES